MAGALRDRLVGHCDRERVTVFWHCGDQVLCTTGKLKQVGDDFVVIWGFTPTVVERHSDGECEDRSSSEALTVIGVESVCAVVLGVPECRKAALPVCCAGPEHR